MTYRTELQNLAKQYGGEIEQRESGHLRIRLPDGSYVTCSNSPRCAFALRKVERDLKKRTKEEKE